MTRPVSACFRPVTFVALLLVLGVLVLPLEPPSRAEWEQYRRDGTLNQRIADAYRIGNHETAPGLVADSARRLRGLLGEPDPMGPMTLPPGEKGMPAKGTVKILALLIDFQDKLHIAIDTPSNVTNKIFSEGDSGRFPYESLTNYYERASLGQLHIQGNVLGWYTAPYNRGDISRTDLGRENLIKEALQYYDAQGHDFTQYDNDGDGKIDYFVVVWTGAPGAWASFWWGYQTSYGNQSLVLDGKKLSLYSWQWESSNYPSGNFQPRVVIHETGHALGLPDYYDYDDAVGPSGGVGGLDMMDGTYGDHNCFSKFMLDWITPSVYQQGAAGVSLRYSSNNPDALILLPRDSISAPFADFFMVQNRRRVGNDMGIPTDGLLVWHVDGRLDASGLYFQYNNSYSEHKLLKLMESDGFEAIENNAPADGGDYYLSGNTFGPASKPNSSLYGTGPSGLGIRNISAAGETMTCDVFDVYGDLTPPTGVPGTPTAAGADVSTSSTVFQWAAGSEADPESGISSYMVQIGSSPGSSDKYQGYDAGNRQVTAEDLENGKTYYTRVCAVNGNRLLGEWTPSSAGVSAHLPILAGDAVEAPALTFTLAGDAPWSAVTSASHAGGNSFQSGVMFDNQMDSFYSTVQGPVRLSFWWKVSSEVDYDFLTFYMDGKALASISGEVNWAQRTYEIPRGPHTVKWAYIKDPGVSSGQDLAWVDDMQLTPAQARGDVDQSTRVDSLDAVILAEFLAGNVQAGVAPFYASASAADLNHSGTPDAADLIILYQYLVGNLAWLP